LYVPGVRFEHSVQVAATPARLWEVVTDVTAWPDFVDSVTAIEPLDGGPLAVGKRYRLQQPKLPENTWKVTELTEGRSFTWEARSPGVRVVAAHEISGASGSATLRLEVTQSGWLASTIGRFTAGMTRRYLDLEATAMKARAEAG
jgi:hypothetical protein